MFPPSYSLATDIGRSLPFSCAFAHCSFTEQSRYSMQQQTGQNNTMSRSPLPTDNMVVLLVYPSPLH
jgi:hypothetical protein